MPVKIVPELSGFAHFDTEIILPDKSSSVALAQGLVFQQASLSENVLTGEAVYTIRYATSSLDFVEKIVSAAKADGNPLVRFRQGYGEPQKIDWKPWITGLLVSHNSMPVGTGDQAGHIVDLTVSDTIFSAGRTNKTVARSGKISAIVQQIASENGVEAVVEETKGEFSYIQSYQDDIRFIRQRLQPRATSATGHGNYLFYMRDNVLHFHSPDYQTNYLELHYYESPQMNMGQTDAGQRLFDEGVSGVRLVAYDPYTGQSKEVASEAEKALRLAKGIYRLDKITNGQLNLVYHLGANGPDEAVAIAQNTYENTRLKHQRMSMKLSKLIDIRAGDFLNVVISPASKRASTWGGVWLVTQTVYLIQKGAVSSTVALARGEVMPNLNNTVAQIPNLQLVPEQEAPGRDLNVREVQSSGQTAGAESTASSNGYATVLDATTLPA